MQLKKKIEELLNNCANEYEISKAIRSYIKTYFSSLGELFQKTQGKDFLVRHTRYIDSIIQAIYKVAIRKSFGFYVPMTNSVPVTLVALGSYGREQMAPYSDIDLMIVYEEVEGYNVKSVIEKILYIIWDTKLKLGHRVHRLDELQIVAQEDDTIKTALIESRYICGSKYLWVRIENRLKAIRKTDQKAFIFKKIEEAQARRAKNPITMEPNIKEGIGSLRDANLLFWIANVLYGANTLRELCGKVYSEEEYNEFRIALEWLFRVRAALHLVCKKKEDRLLMQYIPDVAEKLLQNRDFKAQMVLVSRTLQALLTIDTFTQIFTKKLIRRFLYRPANIATLPYKRLLPGIYLCDNTIYASYFKSGGSLKELFYLLNGFTIEEFDPSFFYYAKNIYYPKKLTKQHAVQIKKLFYKERLYPVLEMLYKTDLLPILITPLKKVMHLPQFDGYHQYPVDIHSIKCIKALENIKDPNVQRVFDKLSPHHKALLRLATLLHDAGKGRKSDHSLVGARLIRTFALKLGFSPDMVELASRLVKYHTLMSNTAFREDIHSEKVVFKFLAKVGSPLALDMLYVLTYADINAVGKEIYTSYNAYLLHELYQIARESFDNKIVLEESAKRVKREEALKKNPKFQVLSKSLQKKILSIESNLFFIKHKSGEIIDIAQKANSVDTYHIEIHNDPYLSIEILRKVPINLGYLLGRLSYLDIGSMEVFKLFDNIKYFKIDFLEKVSEEEVEIIRTIVEDSFDMSKKIALKKPLIKKEEITIDCNHSKTYASMHLNVKNQRGLLAYIAYIFDQFGIDIATAKVHTIKNRAKDLFLIEKNGKFCKNREEIVQILID